MVDMQDNAPMEAALAYYFECLDRGELVDEASLLLRFPQHTAQLQEFFAHERQLNAKVEQLGSSSARVNCLSILCPNCHESTSVAVDATLTDLECSACGRYFSLIDQSTTTTSNRPLLKLGRFQMIERLGLGAYGSVWKAHDESLDRIVALKIPRHAGLTPEQQEKFFREARAAAQLRHPGIVPVLDIGRDGDSVFIVSEFVCSVTLDKWFDVRHPAAREAAELCAKIADGLHHAHEQGIVHRDLKPANILIDAGGQPYLTDFGLARRDAGEITLTLDGQTLGTPAYMSPEQAEGKSHAADRRSDVYSLGVILYQLLTGKLPFRGNPHLLINQVIHHEPPSPRKLNAKIERDLETIVGKAMEKCPDDRYVSACELASDLRSYLACKPIRAKPASRIDKLNKWSRRHHVMVGVTGIVLTLLSAVLLVSMVLLNRARVDTQRALDAVNDQRYLDDLNKAFDALEKGWSDEVQSLLVRHIPQQSQSDRRGLEWSLLDKMTRPPQPIVLAGHVGAVNELARMPDRRHLVSAGEDGMLRIWDLASHTSESIEVGEEPLHALAISPDGRFIATGSSAVHLCDLRHGNSIRTLHAGKETVESLAFSADGKFLAVGRRYNDILLLSLDGEVVKQVPCGSRVESLEFVAGQSRLLVPNRRSNGSRTPSSIIQLWHGDLSGIEQEIETQPSSGLTIARSSPCGEFIAACEHYNARTYVIHRASGRIVGEAPQARDRTTALRYSPDGSSIAVGHLNGVVELFGLEQNGEMQLSMSPIPKAIAAHRGRVVALEFVEANLLATSGEDGLIKIWDLSQTLQPPIALTSSRAASLSLSPDTGLIAVADDGKCRLLDERGSEVGRFACDGIVRTLSWSPPGDRVAICCNDHQEVVIHDRDGAPLLTIGHKGVPCAATFSPDGKLLAVIGDSYLQLFEADEGREVHRHRIDRNSGRTIAFSADGNHLAYGGRSGATTLMDVASFQIQRRISCNSEVHALMFSPDGSLIATGHRDAAIRLWNLKSGRLKAELTGHERVVQSIAFSPDSRALLSTSADGTLRLWSIGRSCELGIAHRVLTAGVDIDGEGVDCELRLSSDGRRLAMAYTEPQSYPKLLRWNVEAPASIEF